MYGNQTNAIKELTNKDISEITDPAVLAELNNLFVDLNRRKQPLVNPDEIKKVSSKVEELLLNVEAKEPKVKSLSGLEKGLDKLTKRTEEIELDVSVGGEKEAISLARELNTLKKSISKSLEEGKISIEEFENLALKINQLTPKIQGKITEFNTSRFNISKDVLNNADLKGLSVYEKEIIERLKEVEFIDDIGFADDMLVASINISNGVPPIKKMGDLLIADNNARNSTPLSELIQNRVDKFKGKKSMGTYTMIHENSPDIIEALSRRPLSLISDYFRAERDVKNAGLIDKAVIDPMLTAYSKLQTDVAADLNTWTKALNYGKKFESTEAATNQLIAKIAGNEISNRKLGILLMQIERNSTDGKNVFKTILDEGTSSRYDKKELEKLTTAYNLLPKKMVDGFEVIDINKAMSGLTVTERKKIDAFRDIMDNNLNPKQAYANALRGRDFGEVENYVPHIIIGKKARVKVEEAPWDQQMFSGNTKVASDRGKERV